jgi:LysM repeat protein
LGRPEKPAHIRRPHRLAIAAAAPTLFGLAAALSLSAQAAPAGAATAPATAHHAVAAVHTDSSSALMSVARNAAAHEAHVAKSALPIRYTVRSGDSLAAISQRFYHNPDAWPVLYWANHHQIHWANEIKIGQVLNVPIKPARIPNPPALLGPPAAPAPAPAPVQASAASVQTAPVQTAPVQSYAPTQTAPVQTAPVQAAPQAAAAATYSGSGSFQSCVIARESGGNSQVMNGSGHYGLYQFSASTWAAYGGSSSSFGSASVAQQNQVFNNAIAAGGQSNWSAYDGC